MISLLALNGLRVSEATGANDRAGITKPVGPHTLRHAFITAAQMSDVAAVASFSDLRERALPAAQRTTPRRSQHDGAWSSARDLGCEQPAATGAPDAVSDPVARDDGMLRARQRSKAQRGQEQHPPDRRLAHLA